MLLDSRKMRRYKKALLCLAWEDGEIFFPVSVISAGYGLER